MAYLMRRLRQVCRKLDNEPHFLAASATSKDPQGHLEKLVGVPHVIEEDENGSPSGGCDFYIAVSHTITEEQAVIQLIVQLIRRQKRFIVFSHTRKMTEQVFMGLVDQFPEVEGKVMPSARKVNPITTLYKTNRGTHAQTLRTSVSTLHNEWQENSVNRRDEGYPEMTGAIPIFLRIDPSSELIESLKTFGIEIIGELALKAISLSFSCFLRIFPVAEPLC